jgi:hypothetical protein
MRVNNTVTTLRLLCEQWRTRWGDSVEVRETLPTAAVPILRVALISRDGDPDPFLYLFTGDGVTLDNGRGMRDEVDDRESGWARHVDESVTQIVEHGYYVRTLLGLILSSDFALKRPIMGTRVRVVPPVIG